MSEEMNDTPERNSRSAETRETQTRRKPWQPPSSLDAPKAPAGYKYRWIRESILNQDDKSNMSKRIREGWEPVRIDDHPELKVLPDIDTRFEGNVVVGGLMLCKIATEILDQKRAYNESQAATQVEAVENNYLREQDARMPMLPSERSTRVTFGDGS